MPLILRTKTFGSMDSLPVTIYNRCHEIADMKRPMPFVNMALLEAHDLPLRTRSAHRICDELATALRCYVD